MMRMRKKLMKRNLLSSVKLVKVNFSTAATSSVLFVLISRVQFFLCVSDQAHRNLVFRYLLYFLFLADLLLLCLIFARKS